MGLKFGYLVVFCAAFYAAIQAATAQVQGPPPFSGMRVYPLPDREIMRGFGDSGPMGVQSTLIYYKANDMASIQQWTRRIDEFLKPYRKNASQAKDYKNIMSCSYTIEPAGEKFCDVSMREFHPCTTENHYNYHRYAPCIFLKLDDTLNWKPKYYNDTSLISEEMPEDLKQHIRMVSGQPEANTVWVSCDGETPTDQENIGPVQYFPRRGFPSYYFPFTNQEGYLSPLVAVMFERPKTGIVIMIKCKAWSRDSLRHAHFELMID